MRTILLGAIGPLLACSSVAHGALTLHTSAFITSSVASSGLEDLPTSVFFNTVYATGGLTISYVDVSGDFGNCCMLTDVDVASSGLRGWYAADFHGYTSLKLADGSAFNQIQFDAASGGGTAPIQYSFWLNGSEVANGLGGVVPTSTFPFAFTTLGFSGLGFDEVRLRLDAEGASSFMLTTQDVLALDNITMGLVSVDAIPEPATWAMMISGFGLAGTALRRRVVPLNETSMNDVAA